jgi:hypothetical protein
MIEKTAKDVPCHCCGATATQELHGFPVCAKCAVEKDEELREENGFDL